MVAQLHAHPLTLILLTWTIWRAPTNASKWRMGFNSAFKGLIFWSLVVPLFVKDRICRCLHCRIIRFIWQSTQGIIRKFLWRQSIVSVCDLTLRLYAQTPIFCFKVPPDIRCSWGENFEEIPNYFCDVLGTVVWCFSGSERILIVWSTLHEICSNMWRNYTFVTS